MYMFYYNRSCVYFLENDDYKSYTKDITQTGHSNIKNVQYKYQTHKYIKPYSTWFLLPFQFSKDSQSQL